MTPLPLDDSYREPACCTVRFTTRALEFQDFLTCFDMYSRLLWNLIHSFSSNQVNELGASCISDCPRCAHARRTFAFIITQARSDVLLRVSEKLQFGTDGLRSGKFYQIPILVSSIEQFDHLFLHGHACRCVHNIVRPRPIRTFEDKVPVTKSCVSYAFRSLSDWAAFGGTHSTWVSVHKYIRDRICIACPHAVLAPDVTFDKHHDAGLLVVLYFQNATYLNVCWYIR